VNFLSVTGKKTGVIKERKYGKTDTNEEITTYLCLRSHKSEEKLMSPEINIIAAGGP
jgi:hypothetical protein